MQDDVAPAVALPQTPESLPVDPRHNKAPKTPTSLDDLTKDDIALALDQNLMENLGENEEKDSDIDSDSDEETCAEASKKTMTLETVMKLIKKEPTEEPKAKATSAKAEAKAKAASAKKRTRIQMIQDLTEEDAVEEIVAPVPTKKDAGICQVLESLV